MTKLYIPVSCELENLAKHFHNHREILLITGEFVQQNIKWYLHQIPCETRTIHLFTNATEQKIYDLLKGFECWKSYDVWQFKCVENDCYLERDPCIRLYPEHYTLEHYANDDFVGYGILDHELGHLL